MEFSGGTTVPEPLESDDHLFLPNTPAAQWPSLLVVDNTGHQHVGYHGDAYTGDAYAGDAYLGDA